MYNIAILPHLHAQNKHSSQFNTPPPTVPTISFNPTARDKLFNGIGSRPSPTHTLHLYWIPFFSNAIPSYNLSVDYKSLYSRQAHCANRMNIVPTCLLENSGCSYFFSKRFLDELSQRYLHVCLSSNRFPWPANQFKPWWFYTLVLLNNDFHLKFQNLLDRSQSKLINNGHPFHPSNTRTTAINLIWPNRSR